VAEAEADCAAEEVGVDKTAARVDEASTEAADEAEGVAET
jgi:hypothetical protein